jgi:hypothetical protein
MTYAEDYEYEQFGVAYAPFEVDPFLLPISGTKIEAWKPLTLELRDGQYADYLSNDLGARLCSETLRKVIETHCSNNDELQWLEVYVSHAKETKEYYVLHFPIDFPVINKDKSLMAGDMVVKSVLDISIVKDHTIFTLPAEGGRIIFVSENLKEAIEHSNLTGMSFMGVSAL